MRGFSRRWAEAPGPNRLSALVAAKKRAGAPLLDLTSTNPTRAGLPAVEGLALPPQEPASYEPDCRGLLPAREAVARYYAGWGAGVSPDDVFLTASTSEGYGFLFKLLTDPGDNILFPAPSYPLFEHLAAMESIEARPYPLARRPDGGWAYAPEAIRGARDGRTRALCLVSPNNPTGTVPDAAAWEAILALCEREGLPLILDEVFADYAWAGSRPVFPLREPAAPVFVLNGLSKVLCAPQLKLAWMCLHAPPEARPPVRERLDLILDTYLSVNAPVQLALPRLLEQREEIQAQVRARLAENRKTLGALPPPLRPLPGEGGWSQVIALPEGTDEEAFALRLLERENVLTHPGYFFDIEGAHLVVSLLTPPRELARGLAAAAALARSSQE
ncbi:MAG: pyridoxal phosphate-dependent aminotransferase [Candidatus Tectomicrobia bacterium]|nr:pyridoxal phosphate-dependent aminotransferase [Candidatus Tectomicrobia bacterium]